MCSLNSSLFFAVTCLNYTPSLITNVWCASFVVQKLKEMVSPWKGYSPRKRGGSSSAPNQLALAYPNMKKAPRANWDSNLTALLLELAAKEIEEEG